MFIFEKGYFKEYDNKHNNHGHTVFDNGKEHCWVLNQYCELLNFKTMKWRTVGFPECTLFVT